MSHRYVGGLITKNPVTPTTNAAPGVWTLEQALQYIKAGTWPVPGVGDPYWQYTNLLLGTTSTNTGQNNSFLDSGTANSGNPFTITRNGNPTQGTYTAFSEPTGYWGNYFDGSGDFLSVADNTALDLGTGDFTIEGWVYIDSTITDLAGIIGKRDQSGFNDNSWRIAFDQDTDKIEMACTQENVLRSTPKVEFNTWVHFAFVRSGTTLSCYANGILGDQDASWGHDLSNVWTLYVGRNSEGYDFKGSMSNIRIVKGTALYSGTSFAVPTSPLTAISGTSLLTCQSNRYEDNSANDFFMTVNGNPMVVPFAPFGKTGPYRASDVGGSGYFDGSGDYLSVPTNTAFSFGTGDFTISTWIYTGVDSITPGGYSRTVFTIGNIIGYLRIAAYHGGTTGAFRAFVAGTHICDGSTVKLSDNAWHNITIVRESGTVRHWIDGTYVGAVAYSTSITNTLTNGIGSDMQGPDGFFNGYIGSTWVVKGTALYTGTANISVPTSPPTNTSGTSLLCNFTNANIYDWAAKNDFETVGNAQVSTSVVKYGAGSLYLDGSGDWLSFAPTPQTDLGSGDFTIEAWLYRTANGAGSDSGIISRGAPSTLNGFMFGYTSANLLTFNFNYAGPIVTSSGTIPANTWTHVAVSRIGNTFKLFINGNNDGTATSSSSQTLNASDVVYIGRSGYDSGRIVTGYLSDVRVTKGYARYPYSFTPPAASLPTFYQAITPTSDPYFDYTTLLLPGNLPSGVTDTNNNVFKDSSANTFSITRNGNTTQGTFSPFSQTGWSNYFDGSGNGYERFADAGSALDLSGDFTVEMWVFQPALATTNGTLNMFFSVDTLDRFQFYQDATYVDLWINGSVIKVTTKAQLNQWSHYAIVRSGSTVTLYLNGTSIGTGSSSYSIACTDMTIGGQDRRGSGQGSAYHGCNAYISNFRVVKGTAVYTGNFTPSTTPLTAISGTSLLACQSNRFIDSSASPLTAAVGSGVSVQAFSPFNPTASWSAATNGGSGYFDGTGDYLSVADNAAWYFTGDFTVECWAYWTSTASSEANVIAQHRPADPANQAVEIYSDGTTCYFVYNTSFTSGTIKANEWTHLAFSCTSGTASAYINGTRVGTFTMPTRINSADPLTIGARTGSGGSGATGYFAGYIGGTRVINGTGIYSGTTIAVPTTPPTAITNTSLLLNFTNAGIIDSTAKNDLETVGNAQISTTQSKFGGSSMYFDGSGDYLVVPYTQNQNFGTGDFTIEGWFYLSSLANSYYVLGGTWSIENSNEWLIQVQNNGDIRFLTTAGTSFYPAGITTGVWYHFAATRYNSKVTLYINGSAIGSYTNTNSIGSTAVTTYFGIQNTSSWPWNGYLQDIRITKGIARYTQNFIPPATAFLTL